MDVDSTAKSWLDIAQNVSQDTSTRFWQNTPFQSCEVVEDPICLFGKFVAIVSLDSLVDVKPQLEFSAFVRDLCVKAPSVAQYLVQEILNHTRDDSQPEVQGSQELEPSTTIKRSKGRKQPDRSYRLPKSSRIQPNTPGDGDEVLHESPSVSSQDGDELVTCQSSDDMTANQRSESLVTDQVTHKSEREIPEITAEKVPQGGVEDDSPVYGDTLPPMAKESTLHQLQATCTNDGLKRNVVHRQPSVALDLMTTDNQTTDRPLSPNAIEPGDSALPEIDGKGSNAQASSDNPSPHVTELHETILPDPTPSTPAGKINKGFRSPISDDQTATPQTAVFTPTVNGGLQSPLTEDNWPASLAKIEMSLPEELPTPSCTERQQTGLCSAASTEVQSVDREKSPPTQDSPAKLSLSSPEKTLTLADMIAKVVHLLYEMSRRWEIPKEIHSRILTTIQPSLGGTPATAAAVRWPDSAYITSSSTTWSASMWINMLEAGHARSKETTILNMIEWMGASEWYDAELQQAKKAPPRTKRGTLRKRLATIVLDKYLEAACSTEATEGTNNPTSTDTEDRLLSLDAAGIQTRILNTRRKRLNKIFHRGRTLRKLVQMTHLGILFDPDIWSFAKASKQEVEETAARFQANPQKMELLSILDEQVKLLAEKGRPDLSRFLDSLESHSIAPSEEISSLRAEYGFEKERVPQSCLNTAINRTVEGIGHVLGKHLLSEDDSVIVNGAVELSSGVFDRLRSREWLNCWDIAAALEMSDRPVFVKLGLSIPLHKKDANGEVTPISNPFRRWRKQIDEYRRKSENDLEGSQVYFCPLNIHANHFTLLEINEQSRMIYHYDSMASHGIIYCKTKSSLVRRAVEEEFKYLGFGYTETPTPQQKDGWSCGLMVIRNAKRRMMALRVGTWEDEVDPDRVIKEVVGDCQMFLENDAFQPNRLSKKRKTVKGFQSNELRPNRSSKRLREMTEGS